MHLIHILLPLSGNDGKAFPAEYFQQVHRELTQKFGGLTSYSRSPAVGLWEDEKERTVKDDIIVLEVMVEELDKIFWQGLRTQWERRFAQDEIIVRVQSIQLL